jgi:FlaG/FlaF family flagellin (archaellin)
MASETDFYIKQDDTAPALEAQLCDSSGDPVDLTDTSVSFVMQPVGGDTKTISAMATIDDPTNGMVSYNWADGDTQTAGYYNAEFIVSDSSTQTDETFPNTQYISIKVAERL